MEDTGSLGGTVMLGIQDKDNNVSDAGTVTQGLDIEPNINSL